MTLHLARYASDCQSKGDLSIAQAKTKVAYGPDRKDAIPIYMRNRRRRAGEFTSESSLYWIIGNAFACRQLILGFDDGIDESGRPFTTMLLAPELIQVVPWHRRNFGGWRYLDETEVPHGMTVEHSSQEALPDNLLRELSQLGLL